MASDYRSLASAATRTRENYLVEGGDDGAALLLLSSGARPRYLEDIVRALALPNGARLQFRYESKLLARGVRDLFESNGLIGRTGYVSYLDNRRPGIEPEIVPVREVKVLEVIERGSSFIFRMEVLRYVRTNELANVVTAIQRSAQDGLPKWKSDHVQHPTDPFTGYWVNFVNRLNGKTQLAVHDAAGGAHLNLFEEAVRNLCLHGLDFGDPARRLFFNILGLRDSSGAPCRLEKGKWQLEPAKRYRLEVYHYYPDEGPLAVRPMHWLGIRTSGGSLSVLGSDILRADSEYDEKAIEIQTSANVNATENSVTIFRTSNPSDASLATVDCTFNVEVGANQGRNVVQSIVIGVLLASPALVAIYPDVVSWKGLVILVGGLAAGGASVFRFARTV